MIRLANFVKNSINCTKSELIKFNDENLILVNGEKMSLQYKLKDTDTVTFKGEVITLPKPLYYIYNKPTGVVCTNDANKKENIKEKLGLDKRIYTVGRLDKDSHGLIILTNDGDFTHYVLENENIEKEYIVKVQNKASNSFLNGLTKPIVIKSKETLPASVKPISDYEFSITLRDGKYHQIRLLVKRGNNKVVDLYRTRIGNIEVGSLKEGQIKEIKNIKEII